MIFFSAKIFSIHFSPVPYELPRTNFNFDILKGYYKKINRVLIKQNPFLISELQINLYDGDRS